MARPGYLQEQWSEVSAWLRTGTVDPVIGAIYDFADAGQALAALEARQALGKIVLRVENSS